LLKLIFCAKALVWEQAVESQLAHRYPVLGQEGVHAKVIFDGPHDELLAGAALQGKDSGLALGGPTFVCGHAHPFF
jgi:hypothetical protein